MKATKKAGIVLCVAGLFLAGLAAQGASSSPDSSQSQSNAGNPSALVLAIESDGDLDEVAEAISLSGTDVLLATMSDGVTIFAPVDGSFGSGVVVEDVITDYIVPGIIDTATVDSTTTTTAMSGDPVTIAVVDSVVTVNGVPVAEEQAIYNGNVVIYKLTDSFTTEGLASNK